MNRKKKKPVISSFEVIPNQIELGKTAYLDRNVSESTSVTFDNDIGALMLSGNRTITPTETTIFSTKYLIYLNYQEVH